MERDRNSLHNTCAPCMIWQQRFVRETFLLDSCYLHACDKDRKLNIRMSDDCWGLLRVKNEGSSGFGYIGQNADLGTAHKTLRCTC